MTLLGSAWGQSSFPGFDDIPWGSDPATVSNKLVAVDDTRYQKGEAEPSVATFNNSPLAKLTEFKIGPPTLHHVYKGKYNEMIECYFSDNKLGLVVYSPRGQMVYDPHKMIAKADAVFKAVSPKKVRKDLAALPEWTRVDPKMEYMQTYEWQNDEGLVRLYCKTWPINDLREVVRVVYSSKTIAGMSDQLVAAEVARIAAEKKRLEEERARKQAEAERLKAEKAAAAAAAAGTPDP